MTLSKHKTAGAVTVSEAAWVALLLGMLYFALRIPFRAHGILFLDDGETLYHALSLLKGQLWYRDDVSHHFLGYALPFYWTAKLLGFSENLLAILALLHQTATAWGLYLISRRWVSAIPALGVACLYISAREPFNFGFYQQFQINLFFVFTLLLAQLALQRNNLFFALLSSLTAGAALLIDQRCLFLALIPALLVWMLPRRSMRRTIILMLCYTLPALAAIYWLVTNGVWSDFVDQTWRFPKEFRAGSLTIFQMLAIGTYAHRHLIFATPTMLLLGLIGLLGLVRTIKHNKSNGEYMLILLSGLALLPMPFVGSRDFPHYLLTWHPFLALCTAFLPQAFSALRARLMPLLILAPFITTFVALQDSLELRKDPALTENQGDGREQVLAELRQQMADKDTLLVWGYRLDIYAALQKTAAYRQANTLFIQPDSEIKYSADRARHVDPKYLAEFKQGLSQQPPTFVVLYWRDRSPLLESEANTALLNLVHTNYELIKSVAAQDLLKSHVTWEIWKRR
ncbi:MAG: hypothetical protein K1X79_01215 [Oligoflexia bacterium]|nr:hypothetical protein [Oligoflexia bacterium]